MVGPSLEGDIMGIFERGDRNYWSRYVWFHRKKKKKAKEKKFSYALQNIKYNWHSKKNYAFLNYLIFI